MALYQEILMEQRRRQKQMQRQKSKQREGRRLPKLTYDEIIKEALGGTEFSKQSTCKGVVKRPPPCNSSTEDIARWTMCNAFYSPTYLSGDNLLVEHFRKNVKTNWAKYRLMCGIKKKNR